MRWRRVDADSGGLRHLISQLEGGDQLGRTLSGLDLTAGRLWTLIPGTEPGHGRVAPAENADAILEIAIAPAMAEDSGVYLLSEDHPIARRELSRPGVAAGIADPVTTRFVDPARCEIFIPDLGPVFDVVLPLRWLAAPAASGAVRELLRGSRRYPLVMCLIRGEQPAGNQLTVAELTVLAASTEIIVTDGWDPGELLVWSRHPAGH